MKLDKFPKPNLPALFEHYDLWVDPRDRGGWRAAQCPLPNHTDDNPSAALNEELGKFWCHCCAEGGDGLDIILKREPDAGWASAIALAERFVDGDGEEVRAERGSTSLLPQRKGHHKRGSRWVPPWKSL